MGMCFRSPSPRHVRAVAHRVPRPPRWQVVRCQSGPVKRIADASHHLEWLGPSDEGALTGYDLDGWDATTWVLNAMYENASLVGLGSHDDIHRQRLNSGTIAPIIIGDVNLDEGTTVSGTDLGFVVRPGAPWLRVKWLDYLGRFPAFTPNRSVPPCFRWFPAGSWPVAVEPPTEGSLDEESLGALLALLGAHDRGRGETEVFASFASLPSGDFDSPHLWRGELADVPSLIDENGGPYSSSPSNLWAADRSWFVWTDWDLSGTKVSGPRALIDAIREDPALETTTWERPT